MTTEKTTTKTNAQGKESSVHSGLASLTEQARREMPTVTPLTEAQLQALLSDRTRNTNESFKREPVVELTARHPWQEDVLLRTLGAVRFAAFWSA